MSTPQTGQRGAGGRTPDAVDSLPPAAKRHVKSTNELAVQMRAAVAAWDARQQQMVSVVGRAVKVYDPAAMPPLDRALWAAICDLLAKPDDITSRPW